MAKKVNRKPARHMVSFDVNPAEAAIIKKIVARARKLDPDYDKMDCMMDITACHANGNKLKLKSLLDADDFNFAHDVFGIANHIDRTTGKMLHCFRPRFSA